MADIVGPYLVTLEADQIHDERVSVPTADGVTKKGRLRIFGVLPAIDRDDAPVGVSLVQEGHAFGSLNDFKRLSVQIRSRLADDDAKRLRINGACHVVPVGGFTRRRVRQLPVGKASVDVNAGPIPNSGKVGLTIWSARSWARRRRGFRPGGPATRCGIRVGHRRGRIRDRQGRLSVSQSGS